MRPSMARAVIPTPTNEVMYKAKQVSKVLMQSLNWLHSAGPCLADALQQYPMSSTSYWLQWMVLPSAASSLQLPEHLMDRNIKRANRTADSSMSSRIGLTTLLFLLRGGARSADELACMLYCYNSTR